MKKTDIKAMLLHLGYNMWANADTELRLKDEYWRKATDLMAARGYNTLVVDVGEGIVLPSHPELAIKGSWSAEKMRGEIDRLRAKGINVVPKLNFSATHDRWLGEYARQVSTPVYYKVVADVIRDTAEIFGKCGFFHLGWDEETNSHQSKHDFVVVRQGELWWHDFLYTVKCVEKAGLRAWVWSDYGWHHSEYVKRCPKSVLQSNWYYDESGEGYDLGSKTMKVSRRYLQLFLDLDKAGFEQVPCSTNWQSGHRRRNNLGSETLMGDLVKFSRKNISPALLKGFLMTSWKSLASRHGYEINRQAIEIGAKAFC